MNGTAMADIHQWVNIANGLFYNTKPDHWVQIGGKEKLIGLVWWTFVMHSEIGVKA